MLSDYRIAYCVPGIKVPGIKEQNFGQMVKEMNEIET